MRKRILLYVTATSEGTKSFRMNRVIRDREAADRAITDLRCKLGNTVVWARPPVDEEEKWRYSPHAGPLRIGYDLRLKTSLRRDDSPFMATYVEYLVDSEDCSYSLESLSKELDYMLRSLEIKGSPAVSNITYPAMLRDLADSLEKLAA